jgi:subfamily B ATP-binding cassette protein HlyB/CyaB
MISFVGQRGPKTPMLFQRDSTECATTCLAMVLGRHGLAQTQGILRQRAQLGSRGLDLASLARLAREFGFDAEGVRINPNNLARLPLPAIAHVDGNHYVVVTEIAGTRIRIHDPAYGRDHLTTEQFARRSSGVFLTLRLTAGPIERQLREATATAASERRTHLWKEFYGPATRPVSHLIASVIALSIVIQVVGLMFPLSTQWFVDAFSNGKGRATIVGYALALAGAGLVHLAATAVRSILLLRAQTQWEAGFFSRVLNHFVRLPPRTFEAYRKEDFLYRLQTNQALRQVFSASYVQSSLDVLLVIGYLGVLFMYASSIAAAATVAVVASLALGHGIGARTKHAKRRYLNESIRTAGSLTETLLAFTTVKVLGIEGARFEHWQTRHRASIHAAAQSVRLSFILQWLLQLVAIGSQLVVYIGGSALVFSGRLTAGQFVAFITIFILLLSRAQGLSEVWVGLSEVQVGLARLNDVLVQPSEMTSVSDSRDPGHSPTSASQDGGRIVCDDLSFRYNLAGAPALNGVSFEIATGTRVGLVGRNGSGKSTLLKVLAGLYSEHSGLLQIDNRDVREYDRRKLRRLIALVPQDVHVFEGTVRDNLLLARPSASEEDLLRAVESAELAGTADEADQRLNYMILPGATNLSGGERLRVAFARLFLLDPQVILLDESTSALDPEAEGRILDTLYRVFEGRTIICAAHRLNTLSRVDRVMVMERGYLVEDGDREKLAAANGPFAEMCHAFGLQ